METQEEIQKQINKIEYIKTFGIKENFNNTGFNVLINIEKSKNKFNNYLNYTTLEGSYKNKEFALKKAEIFIKEMYKPFIDFLNRKVTFKFINMGLIK